MPIAASSRNAPAGVGRFDVICVGEIRAALALARHDVRVGLATTLSDDSEGRSIHAKIVAAGIDTGGVTLAPPASGLFFVRGGARQVVREGKEEAPASIPEAWSSPVLLLSGVSPIVSHGAALCKAARAARRAGSIIVVDLHAQWEAWRGRDWRSIRMILREADVVWTSHEDLVGLKLDAASARASMRPGAVFAMHVLGRTSAMGNFGEVTHPAKPEPRLQPFATDEDFVAAICVELQRAGNSGLNDASSWSRALARGHAAASARTKR